MCAKKINEEFFVIDTNILLYNLICLIEYAKEKQNIKYLIPIQVIKELERLVQAKNKKEAVVALEGIKKLEEIGIVEILSEKIIPNSIVSYWKNDLADFYIISYAYKYKATLITADKIMFYIATTKSIETVYIDYSVGNDDGNIEYDDFKNEMEIRSNSCFFKRTSFYNKKNTPEILIDTSFILQNIDLIEKSIESGIVFCISIQTLIEIKMMNSFKNNYNYLIFCILKKYINKQKIQIIVNEIMPTELNENFDNGSIDFNVVSVAYEKNLLLVTADYAMYSFAKYKNIKVLYLNQKKLLLDEFSEKLSENIKDEPFEKHQIFVKEYVGKLKADDLKYPDVVKGINKFSFIKKIFKEYIFDDENLIVFADCKKSCLQLKKTFYPYNTLQTNDFILIREIYSKDKVIYKYRLIIYFVKNIDEQILVKISDSFLPILLFYDINCMKRLVSSINDVVLY